MYDIDNSQQLIANNQYCRFKRDGQSVNSLSSSFSNSNLGGETKKYVSQLFGLFCLEINSVN